MNRLSSEPLMRNVPKIPNISLPQAIVEGVDAGLARLSEALDQEDRKLAVLEFMRSEPVIAAIRLAFDEATREHGRGSPGHADSRSRKGIAALIHAAIVEEREEPTSAYDLIEVAHRISRHVIHEASRVAEMGAAETRDDVWRRFLGLNAPHKQSSIAAEEGAQQAVLRLCELLLLARLDVVIRLYEKGSIPDPGGYLYLEDLETYFEKLLRLYIRKEVNAARFGHRPLPPEYELPSPSEEEDEDELGGPSEEEDEDGGIGCGVCNESPRLPGGGPAALASARRQHPRQDRERDRRRIESLRDLVATADRVLHGKQRLALLAKLFSPSSRGWRDALIVICGAMLSDIPCEVRNDEELARLVGSPSGSAAQRNYNLARAKLLDHARDAEQRQRWQIILDALLPRRSRSVYPSESALTTCSTQDGVER
jgi:hypothetical protein